MDAKVLMENVGKRVTIIFVNGYQYKDAIIRDFDNDCIVAECCNGKRVIIYKHAVSTIEYQF